MNDCIFCKIIKGEIPSYTVYEDEMVKVFLEINPKSKGELLVVTKEHTPNISTIEDALLLHVMKTVQRMKTLLEEKLKIDGVSLIQNNGDAQEIKHFHIHVEPYYNEKKNIEEVYDILK